MEHRQKTTLMSALKILLLLGSYAATIHAAGRGIPGQSNNIITHIITISMYIYIVCAYSHRRMQHSTAVQPCMQQQAAALSCKLRSQEAAHNRHLSSHMHLSPNQDACTMYPDIVLSFLPAAVPSIPAAPATPPPGRRPPPRLLRRPPPATNGYTESVEAPASSTPGLIIGSTTGKQMRTCDPVSKRYIEVTSS